MEIARELRGHYINNVYSSGPDAITLRFRGPDSQERLLLAYLRRAAWITGSAPRVQAQGQGEAFRAVRDSLVRLRLASAEVVRGERIMVLRLEGRSPMAAYMEFFGAGNLVVVRDDGVIEAAFRRIGSSSRYVAPGVPYELPRGRRSIFEVDEAELRGALEPGRPVERSLGSRFLAPSKYLEEALWRSGLKPGTPSDVVTSDDVSRLHQELERLHQELLSGGAMYIYRQGEELREVCVARLQHLEAEGLSPEAFESPSRALDAAFSSDVMALGPAEPVHDAEAKRIEEAIAGYRLHQEELRGKAAELRRLATSLMEGGLDVQSAITALASIHGGIKHIGSDVFIDGRKAPIDNGYALSSMVYEMAKKLEQAASSLESKIGELRSQASRLELRASPSASASAYRVVEVVGADRKWYERYHWFFTSGGLLAVGGRDASSNSAIMRRQVDQGDLVFHAELVGSPFFVLKGGRTSGSPLDLQEVAQATVSFSRAWREGLAVADAYYAFPEQVSASAPSGEYLPHGSFMVRGERRYIKGLRLQLAVGPVIPPDGGQAVLEAGPRSAVDEHGLVYAVIEPGFMKASEAAKKVARALVDHLPPTAYEARRLIDVDGVLRLIPPGGSRIVEVARGKRLRV